MEATLCALPEASPLKACLHCASPVSARSKSEFCCHGCETVYGVLQQTGLTRYYSILKRTGDQALPVGRLPQSQSGYGWLDQPEIRKEYETDEGVRFFLEGVHCTACVWLVEKLPTLVPGVQSARLDLGTAVVTVKLSPEPKAKYSEAAHGLLRIGYRPHAVRHSENEDLSRAEDRKLLVQLGIAGAAAGNIMLLAVSLYAGADGAFAEQFKWLSFILSLPVMAYSALPFYQSTWNALKSRQLSIDSPVALGLQISFWVSVANLIRGNELIYFDSVTALVFLLLSSRYLLRRVQRTSLNAQNLAHFLMPATARKRLETGSFAEVSLNEVAVGDILEILPGDLIPADGEIIEGKSSINASLLTGEARPETVECGAQVFGGTQNGEGRLVLRVEGTGARSRVGRILESMESTIRSRAPIVAFSDRVSRAFIGVTLLLLNLRTSTHLRPAPRGAWMGWNRVMPEVVRGTRTENAEFFADFRAWPSPIRFFCAIGAKRSNCRRSGTSTLSKNTGIFFKRAFRSHWPKPSRPDASNPEAAFFSQASPMPGITRGLRVCFSDTRAR